MVAMGEHIQLHIRYICTIADKLPVQSYEIISMHKHMTWDRTHRNESRLSGSILQ